MLNKEIIEKFLQEPMTYFTIYCDDNNNVPFCITMKFVSDDFIEVISSASPFIDKPEDVKKILINKNSIKRIVPSKF